MRAEKSGPNPPTCKSVRKRWDINMHSIRHGKGVPLLLIHGLGPSWRSWSPVLGSLASQREVTAVDLPDFGAMPPAVHL